MGFTQLLKDLALKQDAFVGKKKVILPSSFVGQHTTLLLHFEDALDPHISL